VVVNRSTPDAVNSLAVAGWTLWRGRVTLFSLGNSRARNQGIKEQLFVHPLSILPARNE
jgi:hypothetical protein